MLNEWFSPSAELWLVAATTVGSTLATATTTTASESVSEAPSESVTLILTSVEAGPSGKVQSKLPPLAGGVAVETLPPGPRGGGPGSTVKLSWPGSVTV